MTAATAFASLRASLFAVHGSTATLVGNGWRKEGLTVCLHAGWGGSQVAGIDIARVEPIALVATSDIEQYEFDNGWTLEVGDDTYRITAKAGDDMDMTTLTLAKT